MLTFIFSGIYQYLDFFFKLQVCFATSSPGKCWQCHGNYLTTSELFCTQGREVGRAGQSGVLNLALSSPTTSQTCGCPVCHLFCFYVPCCELAITFLATNFTELLKQIKKKIEVPEQKHSIENWKGKVLPALHLVSEFIFLNHSQIWGRKFTRKLKRYSKSRYLTNPLFWCLIKREDMSEGNEEA